MIKLRKKRKRFNMVAGKQEIKSMINDLPDDDACYKFISTGGFSSISFILFVAELTKIKRMMVSTFGVGKKELQALHALHKNDRLDDVLFVVFALVKESKNKYDYYGMLESICKQNGWHVRTRQNHSKVILLDTEQGKYVIETSSNLNENPKIEQFSFEKDDELFAFYEEHLFGMTETGDVI